MTDAGPVADIDHVKKTDLHRSEVHPVTDPGAKKPGNRRGHRRAAELSEAENVDRASHEPYAPVRETPQAVPPRFEPTEHDPLRDDGERDPHRHRRKHDEDTEQGEYRHLRTAVSHDQCVIRKERDHIRRHRQREKRVKRQQLRKSAQRMTNPIDRLGVPIVIGSADTSRALLTESHGRFVFRRKRVQTGGKGTQVGVRVNVTHGQSREGRGVPQRRNQRRCDQRVSTDLEEVVLHRDLCDS